MSSGIISSTPRWEPLTWLSRMGTASGKNYTSAPVVHTEWMRYYHDVGVDACKIIRSYFVDFFSGERWNMEGSYGSNERLDSIRNLTKNATEGLARAMVCFVVLFSLSQYLNFSTTGIV